MKAQVDPDIGVEWPIDDPLLSERDKFAPRLAEVADELPFEFGAAAATDS